MGPPKENRPGTNRAAHRIKTSPEHPTRRPPAFQEYGSDLLTLEPVRLMTLGERGLFATMRWFVWANDSLPKDPESMARVLGLNHSEVRDNLTARVMHFFSLDDSDPTRLVCPELAVQMCRLKERREKQAVGGRFGANVRREKRFTANSNLEVDLKVSEQSSAAQNRQEPVYSDSHNDFRTAYDGPAPFEQEAAASRKNGAAHPQGEKR